MADKKDGTIFTVIWNYWRQKSSAASSSVAAATTRLEKDFPYQQKEHREAYQSTYGNFSTKLDSDRQIHPESIEDKESENTVKNISYEYCSEATIHGIRHIVPNTNKIRRFVYIVLVLIFSGILLKLLLGILILYSKNPYSTYYYAKVMKVLDFPTVTMCNVEEIFSMNDTYEQNTTLESIFQAYIPDSIAIEECYFNSNECHEIIPTIMIVRKQIHGCYIIRGAVHRTFDMEDLKGDMGLSVDVSTKKVREKGESGVRVFLHEDKTFPSQMDSSFFAGPRDATFAVIQPEKVIKLGTPYHEPDEDCRDNESPSFVNPLKFYKYYSITNCQRECTSLYIEEYCNCTIPFFPGDGRACTYSDLMNCVLKHLNASLSQETYIYRCKCTPNCSYLQYDSRVSVTQMRYSKRSSDDMFRIRVYFENMVMKFLKEKPKYEIDDLLASFGGQMGLFLGASVISVYELLEFIFILLWTFFTTHFRKSETQFKRTTAVRKKNANVRIKAEPQ